MPPASATSHRKQPCNGCRSRKKRCDTARPACSNCRKWGIPCDYTNRTYAAERAFAFGSTNEYFDQSSWTFPFQDSVPAVNPPWQVDQGSAQNNALTIPDIFSGLDTDLSSEVSSMIPETRGHVTNSAGVDFAALIHCSIEAPDLNKTQASDSGSGSLTDTCPKNDLPPEPLLLELVHIYFAHHQIFLPFLHKSRYVQKVERFRRESPSRQESALLYAVIAIAAVSHPDAAVRDHRLEWFTKSKQLSENTEKRYPSLQEIQASLCICILAWTTGDYPLCWLSIGTAWRQAVTLGLNRVDGDQYSIVQEGGLPKCALEKEEQRRTIWTLFLMDRGMAFPCGWPHAIDDRQFMVNLPVDEDVFQSADEKTPVLNSTMPFSRNLRKMITSTPTEASPTSFQAILKAYVLLGRVTEHVHSMEASSDPEEHFSEFQQLDTELSRFKLSLPRTTTTIRSSSSVKEATHAFWLNAITSILIVLLHHRAARGPPQPSSAIQTPVSESHGSIEGFEYCIAATENLSRMIQDATRISIDALINPHIGSSLYGCGRTLALHYAASERKSEKVRSDIDMYLLLFDRIADVYPTLGTKFGNGMRYTLAQAPEVACEIKADGARGMLTKCGDWAGSDPQATLQNLTAAFSRGE